MADLDILFPNGQVMACQIYINDPILGRIEWDGTVGSATEEPYSGSSAIDFDVSNNPIYIGKAEPGSSKSSAVWQIRKVIFDGSNNPTDIKYANGSLAFDQVWNNRTSLSYS